MSAMEISLDGQTIDLQGCDLNAVLDAANAHLTPSGRIVVEVEADGRDLTGQALDEARTAGLVPVRLALHSADPRDLVVEALAGVRHGLTEAQRLQTEAADALQRDDGATAMANIKAAVDRWQDLQRVVVQTGGIVHQDIGAIRVGEGSVEEAVIALADRLRELSVLLAAGDTVAVADELLYVWPDLCTRWEQTLEAIMEVVHGEPPASRGATS